MKNGHRERGRARNSSGGPALQVICLASGGGPAEDNVTGFLVRAIATEWSKGSVLAVDAGTHLAAITRILQHDFPLVSTEKSQGHFNGSQFGDYLRPGSSGSSSRSRSVTPEPHYTTLHKGPFSGLRMPYESARANALHVVRECVSTYLITHPHLDHLSAFAINTAAFHNTTRPKRLAALPSTVNAIKTHIFNDIIWPNLTDEDGGVGFVTFQRLVQGGNIAVGEGASKGYMEVCDGLCVKGMKVSHGHCTRGFDNMFHRGSDVGLSEVTIGKHPTNPAPPPPPENIFSQSFKARAASIMQLSQPGTPSAHSLTTAGGAPAAPNDRINREVVVDSTAYFIRDDQSGREILFFGDVEPDSLSLNPRTAHVWTEAADKIAHGTLKAIFIECSYDDSQGDAVLFGHLAPRHLIRELSVLADLARQRKHELRERRESRKRKRGAQSRIPSISGASGIPPANEATNSPIPPKKRKAEDRKPIIHNPKDQHDDGIDPLSRPEGDGTVPNSPDLHAKEAPLAGLSVIVMHMKDTLRDGPVVGDTILRQLLEHDDNLKAFDGIGLGCEFVISKFGGSYFF